MERGPRNHLRAFYRWMLRLGARYVPTNLNLADFKSIACSERELCRGRGDEPMALSATFLDD